MSPRWWRLPRFTGYIVTGSLLLAITLGLPWLFSILLKPSARLPLATFFGVLLCVFAGIVFFKGGKASMEKDPLVSPGDAVRVLGVYEDQIVAQTAGRHPKTFFLDKYNIEGISDEALNQKPELFMNSEGRYRLIGSEKKNPQ
jgi:hypothetical protein